jgi:gluconate kinase
VNNAKKARKENPNKTICVAFALYRKGWRDLIRKLSDEPVSFVQIDVTLDEFIARNMPRVEEFCKEAG